MLPEYTGRGSPSISWPSRHGRSRCPLLACFNGALTGAGSSCSAETPPIVSAVIGDCHAPAPATSLGRLLPHRVLPGCRLARGRPDHHDRRPAGTTRDQAGRRAQHPRHAQASRVCARISGAPGRRRARLPSPGAESPHHHVASEQDDREPEGGGAVAAAHGRRLRPEWPPGAGADVSGGWQPGVPASMASRCWAWAKAGRGRSGARTGGSSRCSSTGGVGSRDGAPLAERHVWLAEPRGMLVGTGGWGLFVRHAVGAGRPARSRAGACSSRGKPRRRRRARRDGGQPATGLGKGCRPVDGIVPGLFDSFVFDAHEPAALHAGLRHDHRARRAAAEVGAGLHAVPPHAGG